MTRGGRPADVATASCSHPASTSYSRPTGTLLRLILASSTANLFGPPSLAQQDDPRGEPLAAALPELVTDRPDVTESTSIVPTGWAQVEAGASFGAGEAGVETLAAPGTLIRVGLTERVEARLGWEGLRRSERETEEAPSDTRRTEIERGEAPTDRDVWGAGDGEASLKVLLLERDGPRPDFAVLPTITLPLGSDDFSTRRADPGAKALLANHVSDRLAWGANFGVAWPTERDERGDARVRTVSWSVSVGVGISERLGTFVEYFGEDPSGEQASHSLDSGLTFGVTDHLQLDASGGAAVAGPAPDWFVGAGLGIRLPL